jgi:hypothetical protein
MSTLAERILRAAEGEVGVTEDPIGSNRGRRVEAYQAATHLAGSGWAWCGSFVCWVWQRAGLERELAQRIASPSTALMCQVARGEGLICSPRPGAAVAWCGTHVELLHSPMGGDVWRTIGGNTGDAVRYRTRSLAGALVYGPPGLDDLGAPAPAEPLYFLEDVHAEYRVVGPWDERPWADARWRDLRPDVRRRAKIVATGEGRFALRIGQPRHYGPWRGPAGKAIRDERVRPTLEGRLQRKLRPYRTERMPAAPLAAAEALGKTD